jgi:3-methyladenine DNA glycosylase AlkD
MAGGAAPAPRYLPLHKIRPDTEAKRDQPMIPAALARQIAARIDALPAKDTTSVRQLRREYSAMLKKESPELVVGVALLLVKTGDFLARFVGYELVHHHRAALASLDAKQVEQLGHGIDRWEAVDTFGSYLSGPAWRDGQVPDNVIHRWAKSKDRWWRRAALVSTVPLNNRARGGHGDAARTLCVCEMLLADRDDMVVKAMSWALRELAKRDAKAVRGFMKLHASKLAPRVVREVGNKLTTGLKNP